MTLLDFFNACVSADYQTVGKSADYAATYRTEDGRRTLDLYFEASNGVADWQSNLDFPARVSCEDGVCFACHRGFLRVFDSLLPHILPLLTDTSVQRVYFIGYSHGAALATLAYATAHARRPDLKGQLRGLGFGSPRVLFGKPADPTLFTGFYPVRNGNDLVTHLPPALLGYRHVNRVLSVGARGRYSPIDAHRPESYVNSLSEKKMLDLSETLW